MSIAIRIGGICLLWAGLALAQQAAFDVASVKLCRNGVGPTRLSYAGGHLELPCLPLLNIITFAYGDTVDGRWNYFPMTAVGGGPSWIQPSMPRGDTYTIDARTAPSVGHDELVGTLLRQLLADRFKLVVHRETRRMPVYALTVDKRGPKLKPFDGSCTSSDVAADAKPACEQNLQNNPERIVMDIRGITLAAFVRWLNQHRGATGLDNPIADRTEVGGLFDIHLEYRRDIAGVGNEIEAGIGDALREQLGLKLERATGPREFLVIEHVERPGEN